MRAFNVRTHLSQLCLQLLIGSDNMPLFRLGRQRDVNGTNLIEAEVRSTSTIDVLCESPLTAFIGDKIRFCIF